MRLFCAFHGISPSIRGRDGGMDCGREGEREERERGSE